MRSGIGGSEHGGGSNGGGNSVQSANSVEPDDVSRLTSAANTLRSLLQKLDFSSDFGVPETDDSIHNVELLLQVNLPPDYKYFLRHLGGEGGEFLQHFEMVGLAAGTQEYEVMVNEWDDIRADIGTKGPVKPMYKNVLWWPVAVQSHEYLFVDMDPPPGGQRGQIIYAMDNNFDRHVVADSFTGLLERLIGFFKKLEMDMSPEIDMDEFFENHFHVMVYAPLKDSSPKR